LKQATTAQATSAAIHGPRRGDLAGSAQLESDALQSMADVGKGIGEEIIDAFARISPRSVTPPYSRFPPRH
jgi:hypothetical protein